MQCLFLAVDFLSLTKNSWQIHPPPGFRAQRIIWWCVVFGGICASVFHSYIMAHRYFLYNVQTTVSIQSNSSITFPAVTVCNKSPMQFDYTMICTNEYMAMEKLVRFNIFYHLDFQNIIIPVIKAENKSYLVIK
jgi:hypothetical protein